jgi:hypothetical protein
MSEAVAAVPAAAPAPAPEAPASEPKAAVQTSGQLSEPSRRTVKVDGKELQVTDDELVKGYQLEATGRARLAEASKQLAEAKSLEAKLKAGGDAALRAAGWSDDQIEELAVQVLSTKQKALLEQERLKAMDPRERENLELKQKLAEREAADKKAAEQSRTQQIDNATQRITGAVIQTLELLPESVRKSKVVAARVLDSWGEALDQADELQAKGVKITPEWIAKQVSDELRGLTGGYLTHAKDEELEELLPATVRGRIAKKAGAGAHPDLTSKPLVRESKPPPVADKPRTTGAGLLRRIGRPG